MTEAGTPVRNGPQTAELLEVLLLPQQITKVKTEEHRTKKLEEAQGNRWANKYAKLAASSPVTPEIQVFPKPWDYAPCILLRSPRPQQTNEPSLEGRALIWDDS